MNGNLLVTLTSQSPYINVSNRHLAIRVKEELTKHFSVHCILKALQNKIKSTHQRKEILIRKSQ
jgi:hypothetical protein